MKLPKSLASLNARLRVRLITGPDGKPAYTVTTYYPKDGAGRLYVVIRDIRLWADRSAAGITEETEREMVGCAGGYGYDKETAALSGFVLMFPGLSVRLYNHAVPVAGIPAFDEANAAIPEEERKAICEREGAYSCNAGKSIYYASGLARLAAFGCGEVVCL